MADSSLRSFTSSAVSSVLYNGSRHHDTGFRETKTVAFIYSGEAAQFHEWEFRTRLRLSVRDPEYYKEAVSKVVEGLRGDAFIVAQEMGFTSLTAAYDEDTHTGGGDTLIDLMKTMVFLLTTH